MCRCSAGCWSRGCARCPDCNVRTSKTYTRSVLMPVVLLIYTADILLVKYTNISADILII